MENKVKKYYRIVYGENEVCYYVTSGSFYDAFQYADENFKDWWSIDKIDYETYREEVGY